jgi:hypothetical protein
MTEGIDDADRLEEELKNLVLPRLLPEAKVTIIVETDDEIRTMTIPLASSPMFGTEYFEGIKRVTFDCYALYDIDKNCEFTWEGKEKGA